MIYNFKWVIYNEKYCLYLIMKKGNNYLIDLYLLLFYNFIKLIIIFLGRI